MREPESFKGALRFLEQDAWKRPGDAAWFLKGGRKEEEEEGDGFVFHNILDIRCPWRAGPTYSVFFWGVGGFGVRSIIRNSVGELCGSFGAL